MDWPKRLTGKQKPEPSPQPEHTPARALSPTPSYAPDELNEHGEYVKIGGSPVPGLTLKCILRGHTGTINRIAWSPDGRLLASPSRDKTIRIWDVSHGECTAVLEGLRERVLSVVWSPNGKMIASIEAPPSETRSVSANPIYIWGTSKTGWKIIKRLKGHIGNVQSLAWSVDGRKLITGGRDGQVLFWDVETWQAIHQENCHDWVLCLDRSSDGQFLAAGVRFTSPALYLWNLQNESKIINRTDTGIASVSWGHDGKTLATGSQGKTIIIWDAISNKKMITLEGHTHTVSSLSFSSNDRLLVSKSTDDTVRFWRTDAWQNIAILPEICAYEYEESKSGGSLSFHPTKPNILISLGEKGTQIRVWNVNYGILLSNKAAVESVRYTTAKLVLVGDSGVGKTGLGWRLKHGEFQEHSSTHGQQFWVIDKLCTTRKDGTECVAVLWDLAGQHVYRQIHSIFLDNVDASLVLFDPSNRQDPLKGAQFWLEQLKGRGQLPPSVLVGARVDRGAPALSQDYLAQFCQRYGISGGYVSTSAKSGEGLEALVEILKDQIPWDEMTTTVTTVTFKRIKDYVLALKEKPDRAGVLISPEELREQLEATDADWQFTDAEMMTAVGHLETHGHVTILQSSSGETYILLPPDLLVDLASSIVLLADKHERELGAVNETELLQGRYPLDELAGLDETEQQVLLDAAVLRFLEHNVCFRETFGLDTLLIFPGLIKQKRPLEDDFPATDDVSYVVRGRVENLYAMLVVLLGYTPSFVRINQWQNQAQYEMGKGEICGFRVIADREGEIELVLYYSEQMPHDGRASFQELFERFLYQREVEVTRFPPVVCLQGHQMERATVIRLIREGKTSAFCAECGGETDLPELDRPGIGIAPSGWLQREEAAARLRSMYETHLVRVKGYRRGWATPRCYLSHAPGQESYAKDLIHDLQDAGVYIIEEAAQVQPDDYVVVLDTPTYQEHWKHPTQAFAADVKLVKDRMARSKRRLISIKLEGIASSAAPHDLRGCTPGDFRDATHYPVSLFNLVLNLYAIPFTHAGFAPLRESLHQQWEQMPREAPKDDDKASKKEAKTKDEEEGDAPVSERYVDFDLHIAPDGHAVASSIEGQASAEIPTEAPRNIPLSLKLIEKRATDADLLKEVGQAFYDWLFPGPIHTHFQQTEAVARRDNTKMRLRLRIEAEEIASLPLEFLYREIGGYYIALNPDTVLSRYLNLPMPPGYARRREGPLHMLAIIADPSDQTRLDPDEWETIIQEALAEPLASGQMKLQTVKRATRKEIRDALLRQKPDIIQFVGHGIYKDGKGYLALVNEKTDKTWLVNDEQFANLYMGYDDHLGLISLATCESAKSDDPQGFLGIAPKLVQRGVPAVLSMQYKVLIKTGRIFLEDFYTAVAARKPIDWATQSARNAVALELGLGNREFATPVLYMRAKDGEVF